jgi:hypothetical protein
MDSDTLLACYLQGAYDAAAQMGLSTGDPTADAYYAAMADPTTAASTGDPTADAYLSGYADAYGDAAAYSSGDPLTDAYVAGYLAAAAGG